MFFFSMSTKRLAESVEGLNSSLALAVGDLWPKKGRPIAAVKGLNSTHNIGFAITNLYFQQCLESLTLKCFLLKKLCQLSVRCSFENYNLKIM